MKMNIESRFGVARATALVVLLLAGRLTAQTFATVYTFAGGIGDDGADPASPLNIWGNTLYGSTPLGGIYGRGTLFKINTDGTGFKALHYFGASGLDVAWPQGVLRIAGDTLYGTAVSPTDQGGVVFKLNTDGTGFSTLFLFPGGAGGLLLWGNALYGTSPQGGTWTNGAVFALHTDGTAFTNLHNFSATSSDPGAGGTNSDGAWPQPGLILVGNTLYGVAARGGAAGNGTLFKVNTDGTSFGVVHQFDPYSTAGVYTNSDGAIPNGDLVLSGTRLYGTAQAGGEHGFGTVFALNIDGTGFATLHEFSQASCQGINCYNSEGVSPTGGLVLSGNSLYGTASGGGSSGSGTVFGLSTDGTGFTNLYTLAATSDQGGYIRTNSDGAMPSSTLLLVGSSVYGATQRGGSGFGTLFRLSLLPQMAVGHSGTNVSLAWPTVLGGGFTLQSTTNLGSGAVWTTISQAPAAANGQTTVTNPIAGSHQFYRLIRQ